MTKTEIPIQQYNKTDSEYPENTKPAQIAFSAGFKNWKSLRFSEDADYGIKWLL